MRFLIKIIFCLIPSHVTQICENAFSSCYNLSRVEFEPNSELHIIKSNAFSGSAQASILIPSHVTLIYENAFYCCNNFSRIEFEPNAELQTIENFAFAQN